MNRISQQTKTVVTIRHSGSCLPRTISPRTNEYALPRIVSPIIEKYAPHATTNQSSPRRLNWGFGASAVGSVKLHFQKAAKGRPPKTHKTVCLSAVAELQPTWRLLHLSRAALSTIAAVGVFSCTIFASMAERAAIATVFRQRQVLGSARSQLDYQIWIVVRWRHRQNRRLRTRPTPCSSPSATS